MDIDQFVYNYPLLYHMAEGNSWDSIRMHGLLSTSGLLDLFNVNGTQRINIESCRRPSSVHIKHPVYGVAIIRDQIPLSENKLIACLDGCTPTEWYELLNGKVFFWPTEERIMRLLSARAYRDRKHTIIIVDSNLMIREYLSKTYLSPINTGAVVYKPTPRRPGTFVPFLNWPSDVKRGSGKLKKAVAEVAIDYGVPDLVNFVTSVVEGKNGKIIQHIWTP